MTVHTIVSDLIYIILWKYSVIRLYGFQYHRAEKDVAHLLLWLPKDADSNVPIFATHHCGVAGAIVVPDKSGGKILLVKEKRMDSWKLPGESNP